MVGLAQAAPVTGAADVDAEPSSGIGSAGGSRASTQISTGNANLDKLLEAGAAGAAATAGAASAARAREPGAAASVPGLRDATLRQALRAEVATQADAKSGKQGDGKAALLGMEHTPLREDSADNDPATQKRWDSGHAADGSTGAKARGGEEPVIVEALREFMQFLRTHRIELFAGLALLGLAAVLVRLYSRAR